jgi:tRNA(Ile)-lysidine synthase
VKKSLPGEVRRALDRLAPGGGGLVAAVSGGPDSVALLLALAALRREGDARPLAVAHFNHGLRGEASDADEVFVRELAARLEGDGVSGLTFHACRVDTATAARAEGQNLEAVARRLRYDWLGQVAAECGAAWVATGHTADDQAETVLHRLLRGTGLRGLRGIAERRPLRPGVTLVRPLLGASRADVLAYLAAEGQSCREDATNQDTDFTRNRIRHELLPYLAERFNPAVRLVLSRLAAQAEEVHADLEGRARVLLTEAERPRAGALVVLAREVLNAAPRYLCREAFRLLWEREGWPVGEMGRDHWERLAALAAGGTTAVDLPGGVRGQVRERVVQLGLASRP